MTGKNDFDVIIIGGSYAGLSAAMSLGRALRQVLVIDSGKPCNRQTPHSHNFITHDGQTPAQITALAKAQVANYNTVKFYEGLAVHAGKKDNTFAVRVQAGDTFTAGKLLFATGIQDIMPAIPGFAACWGITVIHCPYCHGYEVRHEKTGILGNGDEGFELAKLITNWTKDLTLFTNGKSTLTQEQAAKLARHQVKIIEAEIDRLEHDNGRLQRLVFKDNSARPVKAVYARPRFVQHCHLPAALGCELTEQGHIKIDALQKTTVPGVYACGDNAQGMRSVAGCVAAGAMAGAAVNRELIDEQF